MTRADNHEMRLIERARNPRRLLRERPRQSSRAAPERRGFVGVPFRNGVKIGVAFRVEQDHFAVGATRRNAMTLKLRRDVLDQHRIAGRLRQHLETVSREAAMSGNRGRQHNPAEHAGLDDLGQLRGPVPTQQTVNLLEREIRARITTETVARAGDGSLLVAIAAGQVQGIGSFGRRCTYGPTEPAADRCGR